MSNQLAGRTLKHGVVFLIILICSMLLPFQQIEVSAAAPKIAAPKMSVKSGIVVDYTDVKITCATNGTVIYYTLDNTVPTDNSILYNAGDVIPVKKDPVIIKAIAYKDGVKSAVTSVKYTFKPASPKSNLKAGTYKIEQNITLSSVTANTDIYYTVDGTVPNAAEGGSTKKYTAGTNIAITKSPIAIKSIAVKDGISSAVSTYKYTITLSAPKAVLTRTADGENYDVIELISSEIDGSGKIYYTLDGTAPTNESILYNPDEKIKLNINKAIKFVYIRDELKSKVVAYTYKTGRVATPTATVDSGAYSGMVYVSLASTTGADIYYTLDGSVPTVSSAKYTNPFMIKSDTTIKAFAVKVKAKDSFYNTFSYTLTAGTKSYESAFGYASLNSRLRLAYADIYSDIENYRESHDFLYNLLTVAEFKKVFALISYDNPELLQMKTSYAYYPYKKTYIGKVIYKYDYTKEVIDSMSAEMNAKVNEIVSAASSESSTFNKIKVVHDKLILGASYLKTSYDQLPYAVLVQNEGVCASYAKSFLLICKKLDIPCMYVCGKAGGQSHAWNIVMIDGEWYEIDVTWDEPDKGNKSKMTQKVTYDYFNLTSKQMRGDHKLSGNYYTLPIATATEMNYYIKSGILVYDNVADAKVAVKNAIAAAQTTKASTVELKFSSQAVTKSFIKGYMPSSNKAQIFKDLQELNTNSSPNKFKLTYKYYYTGFSATIYLYYTN